MRAVLVAAVAVLLPAVPARAQPVVTAAEPCSSWATPVQLHGTGFTPGGKLELSAHWWSKWGYRAAGPTFTLTADANGAFDDVRRVPDIEYDSLELSITVKDLARAEQGRPVSEQYASTDVTVAWPGALYPPWNTRRAARAHPGRVGILDASGFIGGNSRTLYVHYVRGRHLVKTLRLGRLVGPCGALSMPLREFGFSPVPRGTYSVRFDTSQGWPNDDLWTGYRRVIVGRAGSKPPARARRRRP
jgi:hypothetical protein